MEMLQRTIGESGCRLLAQTFWRKSAFSLVEVVIALGLVSFVLISLVGLLATGLRSSRESGEDTNLAFCAETAQQLLRTEGFSNALNNANYAPGDSTPDFFFDSTGCLQTDASGVPLPTNNPNSLYACTVTRHPPVLFQTTTNFMVYQLKFVWPLGIPSPNRQQRIVPVSLANCD